MSDGKVVQEKLAQSIVFLDGQREFFSLESAFNIPRSHYHCTYVIRTMAVCRLSSGKCEGSFAFRGVAPTKKLLDVFDLSPSMSLRSSLDDSSRKVGRFTIDAATFV